MTQRTLQTLHLAEMALCATVLLQCGDADDGEPSDSQPEETGSSGGDTGTGSADSETGVPLPTDRDTISEGRPNPLRGACAPTTEHGTFDLVFVEGLSSIDGKVRDGFSGSAAEEVASSGECRLERKIVASCDPPCASGTLCDQAGSCVPFPANQDVGTVTVHGAAAPIVLPPVSEAYLYFDTALTTPPFTPGAQLALEATGGTHAPFVLYGTGIEMLTAPDQTWRVSRGSPIDITWVAGTVPDATVSISINVDQHGATPANLHCEVPDTGALTIPAAMVDGLLDLGISGRPHGAVERHTLDSVETDLGCVLFKVRSYLDIPVSTE